MNQACLLGLALLVAASPLFAQDEPAVVRKARAAVAKAPNDAKAVLALADALLGIDEPEDAWTAIEKSLELIKDDGRLDLKLGDIFVRLAQKEAAGDADGTTIQNFFLDAEQMYIAAFAKDPKAAAALYGKAFVNLQLNRKDEARKAAADALGVDKKLGKAHALQAYMFYLDRKYDAARDKYEVSLKLDKSEPLDFLRLGHCYLRLEEPAKAQEAYIAAIKEHPDSDVTVRSGLYYLAGKNWKKMAPYLKAATEAAPKSAGTWYFYGYSLFLNSKYDESLAAFKKALKLKPDSAQYLHWVGFTYERKNDGKKALEFYRKALKANPNYAEPATQFQNLALAYASNNFEQAEKLLEELIRLAPNNGWIQNNYALVLRDWAERRGAGRNPNPPAEVKRRIKRSGEVYELAAAILTTEAQIQSDCGLLFEYYPSNFNAEKAEKYFVRALEISDFTYRDAWSGVQRLCKKTRNWELLKDCAEGVLGALEDSGKVPTAPVGGTTPQAVPNAKPAMIAQAKAALALADKNLKN